MDNSCTCKAFSSVQYTSLLIPRQVCAFQDEMPGVSLNWSGMPKAAKEAFSKKGPKNHPVCSPQWMAGIHISEAAYGANNFLHIYRSQSRLEMKEFSTAGSISVVPATSNITISEFLVPQQWLFLNEKFRVVSGIVCTSNRGLSMLTKAS